ncbi:hypothetical protein [Microcella sp.]|uniref:hypothetical protein n=1 Tax=Microcella sp. TaxID=1913979 RepID=UPI00299F5C7A|nr:hypothetical protein [Microcella sp.]MDX2026228.1 hypothetical protein [Microcella sp.]
MIVLVSSIGIFARYADGAGSEMFVAVAIIAVLLLLAIGSIVVVGRARSAAMRAAAELSRTSPGSRLVLTQFDRKAARVVRRVGSSLGEDFRPELLVAKLEPDRVSFFRPAGLVPVGELVVGVDIERHYATTINRSNPFNEPCLRFVFLDGTSADVLLYDASTGKWPDDSDLGSIASGR